MAILSRGCASGKRQPDAEGATLAGRAFGGEAAAEALDEGLCDGEAEAGAPAVACRVGAVEPLEDVRQVFGGDGMR